jgi:hypothetical protein
MLWLFILIITLILVPPFNLVLKDLFSGIFNIMAALFDIGIGYIIIAIIILIMLGR